MSTDSALIKILEGRGDDLNSFLSAFPTQLLLRVRAVVGTAGNANGLMEYEGYALPGTSLNDPQWLIKKFVYDANGFQIDSVFANGEAKFNKVMTNYASYTYSIS